MKLVEGTCDDVMLKCGVCPYMLARYGVKKKCTCIKNDRCAMKEVDEHEG